MPTEHLGRRPFEFPGKHPDLALLGDAPLVAETPESLLDDDTTPNAKFFIRNNGVLPPESAAGDAWRLVVEGEVERRLELSLGELKQRFASVSCRMVMECGGNGRAFHNPPTPGNQWTHGGVGCAEWTGVPLAALLEAAGLTPQARFTGHFGADRPLPGSPDREAMSRGAPLAKALDPHTLLVWGMNGEPLPHIHGGPLRLIVPGWPGSLSSKWLTRILVRADPHDGRGMGGFSYRLPTQPIAPGSKPEAHIEFADIESMPVRSIITSPAAGARFPAGTRRIALRGAAWAGDHGISRVDVSANHGQTWTPMNLAAPKNRYDWTRWTGSATVATDGFYELWARATDSRGVMQPHVAANWNPQGYAANPFHRLAVTIG